MNLDCNQTTVSVTFNDPGLDVNEISRREVRLSCSGLDNDQVGSVSHLVSYYYHRHSPRPDYVVCIYIYIYNA